VKAFRSGLVRIGRRTITRIFLVFSNERGERKTDQKKLHPVSEGGAMGARQEAIGVKRGVT